MSTASEYIYSDHSQKIIREVVEEILAAELDNQTEKG